MNKIFARLASLFTTRNDTNSVDKTEPKTTPAEQEDYVGTLTFKITKSKDIDIFYSIPDLSIVDMSEIENLSDIYSKFLFYINEGYLKDDIITILREDVKRHEDLDKAKTQLFIDNVFFNWAMLYMENSKKIDPNQPLISPSDVFKLK